jgi:hypothetical protein
MSTFIIRGTVPEHRGSQFILPVDNAAAFTQWLAENRIDTTVGTVRGMPGVKMRGQFAAACRPGQKIRYTIEARDLGAKKCICGLRVLPD